MTTVIVSIITALLSGALVSYLNSYLQNRHDEIKLLRQQAETAFKAMNRIVSLQSILGAEIYNLTSQDEVERIINQYGRYTPFFRELLDSAADTNTVSSIYFPPTVKMQQKVSDASITCYYHLIDDANSLKGCSVTEIAMKKKCIDKKLDDMVKNFNQTAEDYDNALIKALRSVEERRLFSFGSLGAARDET